MRAVVPAVLGLAFALPGAAHGHDGYSGVIVEPDRVSPGGVIVVRGDNISTDDPVRIALVGETSRTEIATAVTDGEGHFAVGVDIPAELAVGTYSIEVVGASGVHMTASLSLEGAPIFDREDGAPPGRDEGLPVLPSTGGRSVSAPLATNRPTDGSAGDRASDVDLVPLAALVAAVGGFALFVRWSRRPPPAQTGSADLP